LDITSILINKQSGNKIIEYYTQNYFNNNPNPDSPNPNNDNLNHIDKTNIYLNIN